VNAGLASYVKSKGIDSFQKLQVLLFLSQHPTVNGTCQEFSERLYMGDTVQLTKIIADLQFAGLLEQEGNCYKLRDKPDVKLYLQNLARLFENPLSRQELIDCIQRQKFIM